MLELILAALFVFQIDEVMSMLNEKENTSLMTFLTPLD